jgi:hypothetical protein
MLNTYFFDVELLCFWVGPINLELNTSRRIWYTMWCCDALSCVTTSLAASGLTFWSCMPNGGIELRAHPTQLRVTRHRVGCDDTQKRWVWPMAPRPVFLGFGMHKTTANMLSILRFNHRDANSHGGPDGSVHDVGGGTISKRDGGTTSDCGGG